MIFEMVDDVLEDLKSGSIQKSLRNWDKLDKLVNKLGIDLKQYNKNLLTSLRDVKKKIINLEEKSKHSKEKNVREFRENR